MYDDNDELIFVDTINKIFNYNFKLAAKKVVVHKRSF